MDSSLKELLDLLDLETIDRDLYRGYSTDVVWARVYGGLVVAQALVAASQTVEGLDCHSLHAYFLRPGNTKLPILYRVVRSRDGRSFSSRRVVAVQDGKEIFHMIASFHIEEDGVSHQAAMPSVPSHEGLPSEEDLRAEYLSKVSPEMKERLMHQWPIEARPIDPYNFIEPQKGKPEQNIWFRAKGKLPDDKIIHLCVLAYASDKSLMDSSIMPHGLSFFTDEMHTASLDHAIWFHRSFRADEWLLYAQDSPAAAGARGFNRGMIFDEKGNLVASVAQEALVRVLNRGGKA